MSSQALYRQLLRIRRIEEAIAARYAAQQMRCPVHLSIGQEAVAVGVCAALERRDSVFSNHRAHAHYLAKGGDAVAMLAEIYGLENGCCRGVGGSMHMIDRQAGFNGAVPIVGATVPLAVGVAWAARLRGEDQVSTAFFGDGTFEEGVVHESLNFAILHRLPVLFVCENNQYACYTALAERQPPRPLHAVAEAHGCRVLIADGNDVEAVYQAAVEAVRHLRAGGAPVFLECMTYRWREHCGPNYDDDLGYRPSGELEAWEEKCPLGRLARRFAESEAGRIFMVHAEQEVAAEVEAMFAQALSGQLPRSQDLEGYVYAK